VATLSDILHAEDITSLQHLQLFARTVVEGFTTGHHASPHKGFSVEFRQHRPYVQGDEIRRLDWKVFGRSDRFYIREYDEETNLRATIVLDASGSMNYTRQKGILKFDYARKLAASLAYLLMSQQDAVGLVTFDSKVATSFPTAPRSRICTCCSKRWSKPSLARTPASLPSSNPSPSASNAAGLVILISDFFDDPAALLQVHRRTAQKRPRSHRPPALGSRRDRFPFGNWARFENLENDDDFLLLDPATIRQRYH
jgi:uncharacterized protein (DUF58 family)